MLIECSDHTRTSGISKLTSHCWPWVTFFIFHHWSNSQATLELLKKILSQVKQTSKHSSPGQAGFFSSLETMTIPARSSQKYPSSTFFFPWVYVASKMSLVFASCISIRAVKGTKFLLFFSWTRRRKYSKERCVITVRIKTHRHYSNFDNIRKSCCL